MWRTRFRIFGPLCNSKYLVCVCWFPLNFEEAAYFDLVIHMQICAFEARSRKVQPSHYSNQDGLSLAWFSSEFTRLPPNCCLQFTMADPSGPKSGLAWNYEVTRGMWISCTWIADYCSISTYPVTVLLRKWWALKTSERANCTTAAGMES